MLEVSRREAELSRVSGIQGGHTIPWGRFKSIGFERDLGDLSTWVVLSITRSTVWHICRSDWASLAIGPNY